MEWMVTRVEATVCASPTQQFQSWTAAVTQGLEAGAVLKVAVTVASCTTLKSLAILPVHTNYRIVIEGIYSVFENIYLLTAQHHTSKLARDYPAANESRSDPLEVCGRKRHIGKRRSRRRYKPAYVCSA